jgi:hypothetical protein
MLSFRFAVAGAGVCWLVLSLVSAAETSAPEGGETVKLSFQEGDASGALRESPDKKVKIKVDGSTAQVRDAATGKPVGKALVHDAPDANGTARMTIHCWAFSPDGKLVATGAGYRRGKVGETDNEGQICVWEVASGKRVADSRRGKRLGSVREVAFSKDGKTVLFRADRWEIDGP